VFDEVSAELASTLDYFKVPARENQEVMAAFNAQKPDVIAGSATTKGR
jgi:hemoglobin